MAVSKRTILEALTKQALVEFARGHEVPGVSTMGKDELVDALVGVRSLRVEHVLGDLSRDELKAACRAAGLDDSGKEKAVLIDRLLGRNGGGGTNSLLDGESDNGEAGFTLKGDAPATTARLNFNKKAAAPRSNSGGGGGSGKKEIEQYEHADKKRVNNPPVGLVTPDTDPVAPGKQTYRYDPHIDPALQFDPQGAEIERIIDDGLAAAQMPPPPEDEADESARLKAQLEAAERALAETRRSLSELRHRREPYLAWAGKAEKTTFEVPTVSLHVHERIDPKTIIEAVKAKNGAHEHQPGLFEKPSENPPLRDAIDFYKHEHNWSNRLIAGDSLLVMNSLLEKEGMAGKVQMVYFDPPYGVRYKSNFQPFVDRRDVAATDRDEDLTHEPEMLKAFRDTWELGLHSYLAYLRDRLRLAKDLLHPSGSCFVQISDENVHHVREIMDEVFGPSNFMVTIFMRKKGSQRGKEVRPINDYLVWYCRDRTAKKVNLLYDSKLDAADLSDEFDYIEFADGRTVNTSDLSPEELVSAMEKGARLYVPEPLTSGGEYKTQLYPVEFGGKVYKPPANNCWKFNEDGMRRIIKAGRLHVGKNQIRFKKYHTDFPYRALNNLWADMAGASDKVYVVQTTTKAVQRCVLMTTGPGDLVLDITCGSGTTAYVAEQWGRRWMTCDTSRVAITLAKHRLMGAVFDFYRLARPAEGIASGFAYDTVPHVTSTSIANDLAPTPETLYDRPQTDNAKMRITGPFTVEAVPAPSVTPVSDVPTVPASDDSIAREGETARQSQWRAELQGAGVRGKKGQRIKFTRVEPLPGARWLHAEAEIKEAGDDSALAGKRVVISFGPEHSLMEQRQVELAWEEARALTPRPAVLLFCAFQFDPEAQKDIDEMKPEKAGMLFLKAEMNRDLATDDLKKKRSSNESFWLVGQPEIDLRQVKKGGDAGKWQVEVLGFDYFDFKEGKVKGGNTGDIACWLLDTDYDGRSLYPRQVFFPMAGPKDGWARLAKTLKAEIDTEKIEKYRGHVSLPFEKGKYGRIAVKIVDNRGIESLVVRELKESGR